MSKTTTNSQQTVRSSEGSYITGALGALLGASLSGLCWLIVHYVGFFGAFIGFLIALCATVGYNQLHGKNGPGKLIILVIALIYGIYFGILISEIFQCAFMILTGELYGFTLGAIPRLLSELHGNKEYLSSLAGSIGTSFGLGLFGVFTMYQNPNLDYSKKKNSLH